MLRIKFNTFYFFLAAKAMPYTMPYTKPKYCNNQGHTFEGQNFDYVKQSQVTSSENL